MKKNNSENLERFLTSFSYSQILQDILTSLRRESNPRFLLQGEAGTEKEALAHAISKNGAFVSFHCSAFAQGDSGKAFNDLRTAADNSIVFLDEIEWVPPKHWQKLVECLETSRQVVAASTTGKEKDNTCEEMARLLGAMHVIIPPLRDRRTEILPLAAHFLEHFNRQYGQRKVILPEVAALLEDYAWSGNLVELECLIEQLVVIVVGNIITVDALPNRFLCANTNTAAPSLKERIQRMESSIIRQTLREYGSIRKTAEVLGVNASTIMRKLHGNKAG